MLLSGAEAFDCDLRRVRQGGFRSIDSKAVRRSCPAGTIYFFVSCSSRGIPVTTRAFHSRGRGFSGFQNQLSAVAALCYTKTSVVRLRRRLLLQDNRSWPCSMVLNAAGFFEPRPCHSSRCRPTNIAAARRISLMWGRSPAPIHHRNEMRIRASDALECISDRVRSFVDRPPFATRSKSRVKSELPCGSFDFRKSYSGPPNPARTRHANESDLPAVDMLVWLALSG